MTCFHPLKAARLVDGDITFSPKPKDNIWRWMRLPCGQCTGCRLAYSGMWTTRAIHEAMCHRENCAVTLTYKPECLPYHGQLVYKDFQDFMMRLRKRAYPASFRYMACGEYGDQLLRPHFHAMLFGFDFPDKRVFGKSATGTRTFTSAILEELWPQGHSLIGVADAYTAGYIARYALKKRTGKSAPAHYERVDPETGEIYQLAPECFHMSTRPALGKLFFEKYQRSVYPHDFVVRRDGTKVPVPRYYDKLLKRVDPLLLDEVKAQRELRGWEHREDQTPARLAVREKVSDARLATLRRSL